MNHLNIVRKFGRQKCYVQCSYILVPETNTKDFSTISYKLKRNYISEFDRMIVYYS
jgi:hypothetical protein